LDTPVATGQRTQLVLELDTGSTPMSGCLQDPHGRSVEFSGWLGLAAALEEVLRATNPLPSPWEPGATPRP
jgi:hypothetical protein